MLNQNCFLLSYVKYGDNDAFLHCFSKESGYQSFFARGIYSAKNKKKPYLFPLNLLHISLVQTSAKQMTQVVSKLEAATDFVAVQGVKAHAVLFFAAEFLNQILKNEQENTIVFQAISEFLEQIKQENPNAHLQLMLLFLQISGVSPLLADGKFLDPQTGTFSDKESHLLFSEPISEIWRMFLAADSWASHNINREERNAFLDAILVYYQLHFSGFYIPKSVAVLRELFG